ncbi:MAG: hypothetical protein ABFE01_08860 [Phycisphaerales bacterium]
MNSGAEIEVLWFDNDVIELCIRASNGRFAGVVELYVGYDALPGAAELLRGFPARPTTIARSNWARLTRSTPEAALTCISRVKTPWDMSWYR